VFTSHKSLPGGRLHCDDRRSQLLGAALRVFARKGFQGTRTREIAAEAGINEALLFRHFPTKEDLYAAILRQHEDERVLEETILALREPAEARNDEEFFLTFSDKLVEALRRQPDFFRLMLFSALENHTMAREFRQTRVRPLYETVARYIRLRQKEGMFRNDVRPAVAVRALSGMVAHFVLSTDVYGDVTPRISRSEAVVSFTRLFLHGVRAA
jgi:TetR/AcrR family transcriptional regulator